MSDSRGGLLGRRARKADDGPAREFPATAAVHPRAPRTSRRRPAAEPHRRRHRSRATPARRPGRRHRARRRRPGLAGLAARRTPRLRRDPRRRAALHPAAHRHLGRLLGAQCSRAPDAAPPDRGVRPPPHGRPRLAGRIRHDTALRGDHAGTSGCPRRRDHVRRSPHRHAHRRPRAARPHPRRHRVRARRRCADLGAHPPRFEGAAGTRRRPRVGRRTLDRRDPHRAGRERDRPRDGRDHRRSRSREAGRIQGREDLGDGRADRRHRAAGRVPRRDRRRRIPGRERGDRDLGARVVHPVPLPARDAARLGPRRRQLGQPGSRRPRPHPGDHRDSVGDRDGCRDRARRARHDRRRHPLRRRAVHLRGAAGGGP